MKVSDILKSKGPQVFTIGDELKLKDAIEILVKNKIGCLLVLNFEGRISGILSERDVLRCTHSNPDDLLLLEIKDVMTKNIIIVEPEDDMDYVESVMTENRIRHLPVVKDKVLIGMISIGDVVKTLLKEIRHQNKYLMDYIGGNVS